MIEEEMKRDTCDEISIDHVYVRIAPLVEPIAKNQ
jgi:hypothetical protein